MRVEARQLTEDALDDVAAWVEGSEVGTSDVTGRPALYIPTLEGRMRADLGDFVVRGVQGEFHPVKPDIFELTYEPADEP